MSSKMQRLIRLFYYLSLATFVLLSSCSGVKTKISSAPELLNPDQFSFREYKSINGTNKKIKLRKMAIAWVHENVEGLQHLTEQQIIGLYYIVSKFFNRIQSLDKRRSFYDDLFLNMKRRRIQYHPYFFKDQIKIAVLGPTEQLTDFVEYAHWKGKTVEQVFGYPGDSRKIEEITGEGTRNTMILKASRFGSYPVGDLNTLYHEFGHFLHMTTLSEAEFLRLENLYISAKRKNNFLDYYAAQSVGEYFAQGLEAFLAETKSEHYKKYPTSRHEKADLFQRDPGLYAFIESLVESY